MSGDGVILPYEDRLAAHYESAWAAQGVHRRWDRGPVHDLPSGFHVLEFTPGPSKRSWVYATTGMAQPGDADPVELHLFSPRPADELVELLTFVAHYHRTGGNRLGCGHTVNFGRPWLRHSTCDHGLLSLPYLDGPRLELCRTEWGTVRCLWLIPITRAERDYKARHGLEALERMFERTRFDYFDPYRASVVVSSPDGGSA